MGSSFQFYSKIRIFNNCHDTKNDHRFFFLPYLMWTCTSFFFISGWKNWCLKIVTSEKPEIDAHFPKKPNPTYKRKKTEYRFQFSSQGFCSLYLFWLHKRMDKKCCCCCCCFKTTNDLKRVCLQSNTKWMTSTDTTNTYALSSQWKLKHSYIPFTCVFVCAILMGWFRVKCNET